MEAEGESVGVAMLESVAGGLRVDVVAALRRAVAV